MYLLQKFEIMNINFFVAVCSSICLSVSLSMWNKLVPTGQMFITFCISGFLKNLLRKFKFD